MATVTVTDHRPGSPRPGELQGTAAQCGGRCVSGPAARGPSDGGGHRIIMAQAAAMRLSRGRSVEGFKLASQSHRMASDGRMMASNRHKLKQ
eukprot:125730-Hanusia_phi.AAC.2